MPEEFAGQLPPGTFTNPSLERYFTSIERASPERGSELSLATFEPVPDPCIEVTPQDDLVAESKSSASTEEARSHNNGMRSRNKRKGTTTETNKVINLRDNDSKALEQLKGECKHIVKDEDLFTKVTSIVGEMEPGGLTERLQKLGIDFDFLKENAHKDDSADNEDKNQASGVAKICPECCKSNKKYVTWCIECGCVLIGVEATSLNPEDETAKSEANPEGKHVIIKNKEGDHLRPSAPAGPWSHKEQARPLKPQHSADPVFHGQDLNSSTAGRHFQSRLEQAWKNEQRDVSPVVDSQDSAALCQSSDCVSENDRLLYNDGNPRDSLPPLMRAELSLNLRSSADSSMSSVRRPGVNNGKPHKGVQASCPDLGDDIEFEYSDEPWRKSLPNALQAELSLDLRVSTDSTAEHNNPNLKESKKKVLGVPPSDTRRRKMKVIQGQLKKQGQGQLNEVKEEPEVVQQGGDDKEDLDIIVDEEAGSDTEVEEMMDEFVNNLRNDPRFHPRKASDIRPKTTGGVPQPSKSQMPIKSKPRPQSAGKSRPYANVQSKVRASIEAEPPPRRWQRSSLAWSSYNSGELSKPSSLWDQGGEGDKELHDGRGRPSSTRSRSK